MLTIKKIIPHKEKNLNRFKRIFWKFRKIVCKKKKFGPVIKWLIEINWAFLENATKGKGT